MQGSLVYTNTALTSASGQANFHHHTSAVYLVNKDSNDWVEVKFNGGPMVVTLPDAQNHQHHYVCVPGDYTSIEVLTANATIAVYAIG